MTNSSRISLARALPAVLAVLLGCLPAGATTAETPENPPRIALLPLDNLSGNRAPLEQIRDELRGRIEARGIEVLDETTLREFMARHRVRYTGGISAGLGRSFGEETGAGAVLITALDLYDERYPPKMALTGRLVSTGERTTVLWADSAVLSGDEHPGFLDTGLIRDPFVLRERVVARFADLMASHLSGHPSPPSGGGGRRFRPKGAYRSQTMPAGRTGSMKVAVLPFSNDSGRRHAGEILALLLASHLAGREKVEIVEPGVVRQALLQSRLILEGGLSIPQAEILRAILDVDLVLAGAVSDYLDNLGTGVTPFVTFSVWGIDPERRQVIWSSIHYGRGDDGVVFFDLGRQYTAHGMASRMVERLLREMLSERRGSSPTPDPQRAGATRSRRGDS